ncbi:MAG TPA: hypothetical protein VN241_04190 [Microbacterium sp.]|nr:hypothetical protein [Microbacterium sp.]
MNAVLAELEVIDRERLAEIVTDAWLARPPARVAKTWLAERGLS